MKSKFIILFFFKYCAKSNLYKIYLLDIDYTRNLLGLCINI